MNRERERLLLSKSKEELVSLIATLEDELERTRQEKIAAYEIAQETLNRSRTVDAENKKVQQRIKELEDPNDRHGSGLSWLGNMVQIIRQKNRPMRAQEIFKEIEAMDSEGLLVGITNPENFLSGVLSKGKKAGRLKDFKVAGT